MSSKLCDGLWDMDENDTVLTFWTISEQLFKCTKVLFVPC